MFRPSVGHDGFPRRDFLRIGGAGMFGMGLSDLLRASAAAEGGSRTGARPATGVIQIWLSGGPATIDMWDPKPDAPEEIRGEFKPIATAAPGVTIAEHMPALAKVMDRCTLVRSLSHTISAHGPGTTYMATGNRPGPVVEFPALGSLAARVLPARPGIPPYVTFAALDEGISSTNSGYLGAAYGPFEIEGDPRQGTLQAHGISLPSGFSLHDLNDREALRARFDRSAKGLDSTPLMTGLDGFHQQALEILHSDRVRMALDLSREREATRSDYGKTPLGQGALAARRLIEAGARFVSLSLGGWDTHGDNFRVLRDRLLPPLDQALGALIRDLESRGLLDETMIICAGEFGRTPLINSGAGRDHWSRAMAVLLAGGGFPGGMAFGATDPRGMAPARDACSPDDLAATIFQRLGVSPRHEVRSQNGRPIALFREGKCLMPLLT